MSSLGILAVAALILATYRITRLVVSDHFPFEPLRDRTVGTKLGYFLTCPFCVSMWAGFFLAAGQALVGDGWGWQVFVGGLALSGVASLLATLAPKSFD